MNTYHFRDHQLNSEPEIVPCQRLWLDVKLCESPVPIPILSSARGI